MHQIENKINTLVDILDQLVIFVGKHSRVNLGKTSQLLQQYSSQFQTLGSNEGLKSAITKFKAYYVVAVKISLGVPFEPIPFTKANAKGVPKVLIPFLPLLQGDKWSKRVALTLLRIHTLYTLPVDYGTLSAITSGRKKDTIGVETQIGGFIAENLQPLPRNVIKEYDASYSIVAGPNGPSVLSSHLDTTALANEGHLGTVRELLAALSHPLLPSFDRMSGFEPTKDIPLKSGKLSFIQENGGKTRVIAIVDFWSQQALKVLHLAMMKFISRLPTDSTFDQNKGFKRAMELSQGKSCYSYDLSSATDRFPLSLQTQVIRSFFGGTIADLWTKLMKRDFAVSRIKTGTKGKMEEIPEKIKWEVGQPLGAYSSWVTFSITHHLLIQYVASQVCSCYKGLWSFTDYQILGDDVVIWDSDVALGYHKILGEIDVEINLSKSLVSPGKSAGEFCKRLFSEGIELSPIPLTMLQSAKGSVYHLPALIEALYQRWKVPGILAEHWAINTYRITNRDILSVLIGFRDLISGGNSWPWCTQSRTSTLVELKRFLIEQQSDMYSLLTSRSKLQGSLLVLPLNDLGELVFAFAKVGVEVSASLLLNEDGSYSEDLHPLILSFLYHHKLQADPGVITDSGNHNLTDSGAFKRMRHTPSASLDLFFLKTKRRRIVETGQIALAFYYKIHPKGGLFPSAS